VPFPMAIYALAIICREALRCAVHSTRCARAHTRDEVYYARCYGHAASDTVRHFLWVNVKPDISPHFRANLSNDPWHPRRRNRNADVAIFATSDAAR